MKQLIHVRVGNDERPALAEDAKEVEAKVRALFEENGIDAMLLVTHHACEVFVIDCVGNDYGQNSVTVSESGVDKV